MLLQVEALTPFFSNSNWKQHVTNVLLMGEISSNCEKNRNLIYNYNMCVRLSVRLTTVPRFN
jgi:hypothetical protein